VQIDESSNRRVVECAIVAPENTAREQPHRNQGVYC
jgi:hypothetical protein